MDIVSPHPATLEWSDPEPITDDHLRDIARVILNWGNADSRFGIALTSLYPVPPEDRGTLLHVLDIRKKVDLIRKKVRAKNIGGLDHAIREADHCINAFKGQRDIIAHGMIMHDQTGKVSFVAMRGPPGMGIAELPTALTRSRYAAAVAMHITHVLNQIEPQPLPDRPA